MDAPTGLMMPANSEKQLSDEQSLYVRYTDYFPRACLALALTLGAAALSERVWQWLRRRTPLAGEARPVATAN